MSYANEPKPRSANGSMKVKISPFIILDVSVVNPPIAITFKPVHYGWEYVV